MTKYLNTITQRYLILNIYILKSKSKILDGYIFIMEFRVLLGVRVKL